MSLYFPQVSSIACGNLGLIIHLTVDSDSLHGERSLSKTCGHLSMQMDRGNLEI
uniref:Uncharacterized protein n=1 Tax=Anguilla anguilla TaxID=7936 RepID=A0A0E9S4F0_ANGAN